MRYTIPLGGTVLTYEPTGFAQWLARPRRYLSVDVETTGLDWGDTVRVVQVGDSDTAWVLPPDGDLLRPVLQGRMFVAWNAAFDAGQAAALGTPMITLHPPEHDHALKEVDRAALAVCREPEQVVAILRYVLNGEL